MPILSGSKAMRLTLVQLVGIALAPLVLGIVACDRPPESASAPVDEAPISAAELSSGEPTETAAALSDVTVVPGERVGPITPTTSREELIELFGEAVLTDQAVAMGEGERAPGTVVNLGEGKQLTVVWLDDSQTKPLLVKDFGSAWKTPEGLGMNSDEADLEQALGVYQLYGFGWDYGGTLVLENTNLDRYHGNLFLRAKPTEASIKAHPEAYAALQGDALFESDNPNMDPLELTVYDMTVYLNPLGE